VTAFETVAEAVDAAGLDYELTSSGFTVQCPAHDDNKASLSISEGDDGKALVYCFAGCETKDVIKALGLEWGDLFGDQDKTLVAEYVYESAEGNPLIKVLRYQPKGFAQQHWTGEGWEWGVNGVDRVPYQLPALLASDGVVYVVEGEKDADALRRAGVTATTFLGGAGKWRTEYAPFFRGRDVVVVADNDEPGRHGAEVVVQHIRPEATRVRLVVPAYGKDASDHLRAGYDAGGFVEEGSGLDEFAPLDWEGYTVESTEWLFEPYVPRAGRTLAFGAAGSLKSLWCMWLAHHIACDGGRVAYFSLEMLPSITAQRLKRLGPPRDRFFCFTKDFRLGSPSHTEKLIRGLRDFDLIVIDSWTAARAGQRDSNEEVAELDTSFFLPVIKVTGAAIIVIDNTGHAAMTDKGPQKPQHARGASAKGDKMDTTILFERPYEDNNYLTRLTMKKMRYDRRMPAPVEIFTPTDTIEFYYSEGGKPMWPGLDILPKPDATPLDDLAAARLRDQFAVLKGGKDA
jgi:hypothetical protein